MTYNKTVKAMTVAPAALSAMVGAAYAQSSSDEWSEATADPRESSGFFDQREVVSDFFSRPYVIDEGNVEFNSRVHDIQFLDEPGVGADRSGVQMDMRAGVSIPLSIGTYLDFDFHFADHISEQGRVELLPGLGFMGARESLRWQVGANLGASVVQGLFANGVVPKLGVYVNFAGMNEDAWFDLGYAASVEMNPIGTYNRADTSLLVELGLHEFPAHLQLGLDFEAIAAATGSFSEAEGMIALPVHLGDFSVKPFTGFTHEHAQQNDLGSNDAYAYGGLEVGFAGYSGSAGDLSGIRAGVRYDRHSEATFYLRFGD